MPRKATGGVNVSRVIHKRVNGSRYVYERRTQYDPVSRKTKTLSYTLLGCMKPGSEDKYDLLPTRPRTVCEKKETAESKSQEYAVREKIGMIKIISRIEELSGIGKEIMDTLPNNVGLAQKLRTMTWYCLATDGNTWPGIKPWSLRYAGLLPYTHTCMSEDMIHDVFLSAGTNEQFKQDLFKKRVNGIDEDSLLAIDSTTIALYSAKSGKSRKTVHKDKVIRKTTKILFYYDINRRKPIGYAILSSDVPDCATVSNGLKQIKAIHAEQAELVFDNGYCTDGTICTMLIGRHHFVSRVEAKIKWISKLIEKHRDELEHGGEIIRCDCKFSGVKERITRKFIRRKKIGEPESGYSFTGTVNVFIYFSSFNKAKEDAEFRRKFTSYSEDIREGKPLFEDKKAIEEFRDKYMDIERNEEGDIISIKAKRGAYAEEMKYHGYLVLLADKEDDLNVALEKCRKREYIEEDIKNFKSHTGGKIQRKWYEETIEGQAMVHFLTLCLHETFETKLNHMKKTLGLFTGDETHDKSESMKLERKLKNWIEKTSQENILAWFDAVEKTTVENNGTAIAWASEMTERDALFLELMGINPDKL